MFDIVSFVADFVSYYALYLALSLSLNLEFGYAGIPNFGKVLFVSGGAAVSATITGRLALWILGIKGDFAGPFNFSLIAHANTILTGDLALTIGLVALGFIIGAVVGGILGYVMSYPAIHLREDYLGLLLLGMAQFWFYVLTTYKPLVGGTQPLSTVNPFYYFSSLNINDLTGVVMAIATVAFTGLVYLYLERTVRSPLGRTLRAMRDNDNASSALGKDTAKLRIRTLVIASALAGMVGTMYTFQYAYVDSTTWTRFAWTFWPFLIVIIGGAANNTGVALGTFFFILILKGLELVQPLMTASGLTPAYVQDLIFAALLLAILYIRPEGIIGEKPTFTLPTGVLKNIVGAEGGGALAQDKSLIGRVKGILRRQTADGSKESRPS